MPTLRPTHIPSHLRDSHLRDAAPGYAAELPRRTARRPRRGPDRSGRRDLGCDLIDRLRMPSEAAKVLASERYWTRTACARFLERTEELVERDPAAACQVAQIGLQLSQLLAPSRDQQEAMLRALTLLGAAQHAQGGRMSAHGLFRTGLEIAHRHELEPTAVGDLFRRYASLLLDQGHLDRAADAAARAVLHLEHGPAAPAGSQSNPFTGTWQRHLVEALLVRGAVDLHRGRLDDSLDALILAVEAVDPADEALLLRCIDQLEACGAACMELDRLHRVARTVSGVLDRLETSSPGDTTVAARLLRLDGRLFAGLGATRRAERSLRHARRILRHLGRDDELVDVSLDLARLLVRDGRHDEARQLGDDTARRVDAE